MIVKERDATKTNIAYLESYEEPGMDPIQRQGLKQAAARLRADCTSENACVHIDKYFSDSENWLVIHDLRMRHANHTMQTNHLLINSALEIYIIDSRYMDFGLTLNENGQCWAQINEHSKPIASPLNKLNRDIRTLSDIIKNSKVLPSFFGISTSVSIQGYILTNPALRSHKPVSSVLDASAVIASDALFETVWEKRQSWMRSNLNHINANTLHKFGQTLLSLHIPTVSTKLTNASIPQSSRPQDEDTSHCAQCNNPVMAEVREYCFRHMGIFQNQVLCVHCQTSFQKQAHSENSCRKEPLPFESLLSHQPATKSN